MICVGERVAAQIYVEAIVVGFFDGLPVGEVLEHVEVRVGKAAPTFVGGGDGAQR